MSNIKAKYLVILIIAIIAARGFAQQEAALSSSLTADAFYSTGRDLYIDKSARLTQANQAMILFNAAISLDKRAEDIPAEIIEVAWLFPEGEFSDAVQYALTSYLDFGRTADLEVASKAVKYLLQKLGSREDREKLLQNLLEKYGQKNQFFASDIAAQLGFLKAETADKEEAQKFLMYAYTLNKYNQLAFTKLVESGDQNVPDITLLQSMRLAVRVNPLDIKTAFDFSRSAESLGLYAPAAAGYRYCTDVYKYLNPQGEIPAQFYRARALNCLNMRDYRGCRDVLEQVRAYGVFDVMVEAIAASSAKQGGDVQGAGHIFDSIKARAGKILSGQTKASAGELEDLAWYYCFVNDTNSPEDMLAWATKAYDADNNSVSAAAFLAYALVKNGQIELAKPVLTKIGTGTQTAAIAKAEVLAADHNDNSAKSLLKSAVDASPGTFESQKAKDVLKQLGSEYVPTVNADALNAAFVNDFGQTFFSEFVPPDKMISTSLKTSGTAFSYGSEIDVQLAITNNYTEPILICPEGIFKGNIRVDVRLSGDITERLDNFLVKTICPSYEIKPGQALFVPLKLISGQLKSILDCHPQADLNMEITVYVDPHEGHDGLILNFYGTKPVKAVIKRRKLNLDTLYLQQRFDAMRGGRQGQKIKSAELFAGLLAEQQKMTQIRAKYRFVYAEPELLSSALARCMSEDDWILKVQTMSALEMINPDYRLLEAISEQIDDKYWPVRLMSVFLLSQKQGENFMPVLKWVNDNDNNVLVKSMAVELSGGAFKISKKETPIEANLPEGDSKKPAK